VALVGAIFHTVRGGSDDPAAIAHAFIVAILCIAARVGIGTVLGVTLARKPAALTGPPVARLPGRHGQGVIDVEVVSVDQAW